jgi:peptidoglycan/xylan/chitin deacetylase (PgdA/CDA1 family)
LVRNVTQTLITVDTELSALFHQRGVPLAANFSSAINGECADGSFGIGWQMGQMEARGLKGVFFVDPLPALVYGEAWLADVVGPIVTRGHEVQLHIHTEWLAWAKHSPVDGRQGQNLADFGLEDQQVLLGLATDLLMRAGAPRPTAFRAGNYGADDNSLRALAELGLIWDSSVNAPYLGGACRIGLSADQVSATERYKIIEIPVAGLNDRVGQVRPAQICALSAREMRGALRHAADHQHAAFVIVTHSFEMLSRDRRRANRAVIARFEAMCNVIADDPRLVSAGFNDLDAAALRRMPNLQLTRLGPNRLRTLARMAEQAVATWRYERQLRPV